MLLRIKFSLLLILIITACAPSAITLPPTPTAQPAPAPTSSPAARAPNAGTLTGHVTIGPLRPGPARIGEIPPPIPPEVYAARTIQIFAADGATLIANVKINPDGTYIVALPSGNYAVNIARTGIDRARGLPKTITIENGKTVQLDIDIDTGIR